MYKSKIVVLLLVAALLTGCSAGPKTMQIAPTEPLIDLPYEIICNNGEYYLQMEEGVAEENETEGTFSEDGPIIRFDSIDEMFQDIVTGNFTEEELDNLAKFPKAEDGHIVICNPYKLYDAYTPEQSAMKRITWVGYTYGFEFFDIFGGNCSMDCELSDEIKDSIIADFASSAKKPNLTVLSEEQIEDRNATVITWKDGLTEQEKKYLYYTIEEGNKEIFVWECYVHSTDTAPGAIVICGTENGVNFYVSLVGELRERPSVEFLMGFGFREYVETEVA